MNTGDTHIRDIRICQAVSTLSRPIADATHDISKIAFYVLEVETAAGVTGQGYLLSFHYSPNAIEGALRDMKKFVLERDYQIYETAQVQKDYEIESEYFGIVGLQRWALATLNVAMWDAWSRTLGQPIYRMAQLLGRGAGRGSRQLQEARIYSREDQGRKPADGAGYPETAPGARGGGPGLKDHDGRQPGDGRAVCGQADQQRGGHWHFLVRGAGGEHGFRRLRHHPRPRSAWPWASGSIRTWRCGS